jgi:hypothetical protein
MPTRLSPHCYPTQGSQPPRQHRANHVATIAATLLPLTTATIEAPIPPHYAYAIIDLATGIAREYKQLIQEPTTESRWTHSFANELG